MTPESFASKRFLIVDNNRHMRSLVRTMLQRFGGKQIAEAATTDKALESLVLSPPDLVICDRDLTPMDGLDFVRELRSRGTSDGKVLPIILLMSRTDQASVLEAKKTGVNHMLAKPVSAQTLSARISLCFAPRQASPASSQHYRGAAAR